MSMGACGRCRHYHTKDECWRDGCACPRWASLNASPSDADLMPLWALRGETMVRQRRVLEAVAQINNTSVHPGLRGGVLRALLRRA